MGNPLKHKPNLLEEWSEEAEEFIPAQSARAAGGKTEKAASRRVRLPMRSAPAPAQEPALVREPAPPAKIEERRSQASSPEHLRKLHRLPNLRAPYSANAGRPGGGMR